jgi:hydroxyacylglutathione hydrolase
VAGSYVDEDTPIYLLVRHDRLDEAIRGLIRVGLDRVVAFATPEVLAEFERHGGTLRRTSPIDMARLEARRGRGSARVLDVRSDSEFEAGHVPGALHVPHTRILAHLDKLPSDQPLLVYCNSGARAAAAASLLERHGYEAVPVSDLFANYRRTRTSGLAA